MPKFNVIIKEIEIYEYDEIEAVDEDDAREIAWAKFQKTEERKFHYVDSDGEDEIYMIDDD